MEKHDESELRIIEVKGSLPAQLERAKRYPRRCTVRRLRGEISKVCAP